MKKFLMAALVLVGSAAFAHPHTVYDVRLRAETQPVRGATGKLTGVLVNSQGEVIYYESALQTPTQVTHVVVARLSAKEVEELDAQVEAARNGTIDHVVEFCEAIPTRAFKYTADNENVQLLSGSAPCGGRMVNEAEEAQALVTFLNKYLRARN